MTSLLTRRRLIVAASSVALPAFMWIRPSPAESLRPLKLRAAEKGLFFGCGVSRSDLDSDAAYRSAILTDCSEIVPTVEMKWGWLESHEGREDFSAADALVNFAADNRLKIRGHTAIWYRSLPGWADKALSGPGGGAVFENHIRSVLGHFGDRIASWDVVNEAIWPSDGLPGGLRNSVFYRAFGATYIQRAFEIAREVLPTTPLFYNEFGLEYDDNFHTVKRAATLQLLSGLKQRGLIDGLGIQSHLHIGWGFDPKVFQRFLADVSSLGLKILLTELDVDDTRAPANPEIRDVAIAEHARRYLDAALAEKAVKGILVWGLADRYTWMNSPPFSRHDGLPNRGQPLDQALARKGLWNAIGESLDAAPKRDP